MIKSILPRVLSVVLGVVVFGCGSLRKPAAVKTAQPTQERTDHVSNTLSSLNGPLILVDGIEVSAHVLAGLDAEDIEEFSIYKDADAIKTYGIRGTEGVVDVKSKLSKRELRKRIRSDRRNRKIKR